MKKRAVVSLALAVILCGLIAAPALAASYATVVGGWLRLRAYPSYNAAIITSYRTGTVVTVLSHKDGWARVMTPDYRMGYMDTHFLHFEGGPHPVPPEPKPHTRTWKTVNRTAYVTSQNGKGVRLRSSPEVNKYNVMGLYPVGRTVKEIKVSSDGWSYIKIDSKHGYMMSQFLTTYTPPSPPGGPGGPGGPSGGSLSEIKLNIKSPKSGEKLKVTVTPDSVKYTVIWYRADTKVLLSTAKTYVVTDEDVGHQITVRVTSGSGKVLEKTTNTVKAAFESSGGGKKDEAEEAEEAEKPEEPEEKPEEKPEKPEEKPEKPEEKPEPSGDKPGKPEEKPEPSGDKPEKPEDNSGEPEGKPSGKPSHKPDKKPGSKPSENSEESGSSGEESP